MPSSSPQAPGRADGPGPIPAAVRGPGRRRGGRPAPRPRSATAVRAGAQTGPAPARRPGPAARPVPSWAETCWLQRDLRICDVSVNPELNCHVFSRVAVVRLAYERSRTVRSSVPSDLRKSTSWHDVLRSTPDCRPRAGSGAQRPVAPRTRACRPACPNWGGTCWLPDDLRIRAFGKPRVELSRLCYGHLRHAPGRPDRGDRPDRVPQPLTETPGEA